MGKPSVSLETVAVIGPDGRRLIVNACDLSKHPGFKLESDIDLPPKSQPPKPSAQARALDELTVPELREMAVDRMIDGAQSMRKADLVDAIAAAGAE